VKSCESPSPGAALPGLMMAGQYDIRLREVIIIIQVRNSRDYRHGYEWLGILTEALANNYGKPEAVRSEICDVKRELRRWAHRDTAVDVGLGFMVERRIVHDDGTDGYI